MAKCSECGQILSADVVRCTNCGISVTAGRQHKEIDEPLRFAEEPAAVIDLRDLSILDLRDLVVQLSEDEDEMSGRRQGTATAAVGGGTTLLMPTAVREQWTVQAKTSNLLFPHAVDEEPRPTIDDIAPPPAHTKTPAATEWTPATMLTLGAVVAVILAIGIMAALIV